MKLLGYPWFIAMAMAMLGSQGLLTWLSPVLCESTHEWVVQIGASEA